MGCGRALAPPDGSLAWNTATAPDGWHEVRVVAVESGPIRSQGRGDPAAGHGESRADDRGVARAARKVETRRSRSIVKAKAPGCNMLVVLQGTRLVGGVKGDRGTIEIDPARLGAGPVRLQVIGLGHGVAETASICGRADGD